MMVFWEQRLVVLATPKTGSTALASALESRAALISKRPPEVKHTTAARYQWLVRPFLEKSTRQRFTVVALMREPVDWLGSWYRFRQRRSETLRRVVTAEQPAALLDDEAVAALVRDGLVIVERGIVRLPVR